MIAVKLTANLDPAYQRTHEAVAEKALVQTFMARPIPTAACRPTWRSTRCCAPTSIR
jgi:hypothetical protein